MAGTLPARRDDRKDGVHAARTIREGLPTIGAVAVGIELHDSSGRPIACADIGVPPEGATHFITRGYKIDPLLPVMRATHATVAIQDVMTPERYGARMVAAIGMPEERVKPVIDHVLAPLVGRGAIIGGIRAATRGMVTPELRADLTALAMHVSTAISFLGLPAPWVRAKVEAMTPRQREVLLLVARGLDDAAVASTLGVPPRSVTRTIKQVLLALKVRPRNRGGVATLLGRNLEWIDGYASLDDLEGINVMRAVDGKIVHRRPWPHVA